MRRSCSPGPNFQTHTDVLPQCAASCGRVRFPFLSWGSVAVLCILTSVLVYLAEGATRDLGEADRSLLGKAHQLGRIGRLRPRGPLASLGRGGQGGISLGPEARRVGHGSGSRSGVR